jgi:hypothetical protein
MCFQNRRLEPVDCDDECLVGVERDLFWQDALYQRSGVERNDVLPAANFGAARPAHLAAEGDDSHLRTLKEASRSAFSAR